jgi:hypothetical protein
MREICQSGSEGGGGGTTASPYPYHDFCAVRCKDVDGAPARTMTREGRCSRQVIRLFRLGSLAAKPLILLASPDCPGRETSGATPYVHGWAASPLRRRFAS